MTLGRDAVGDLVEHGVAEATEDAGAIPSMNVLRVLDEPTASGGARGLGKRNQRRVE